jgi:5-(carboxyamino)imidazole ribonucleotide mutase
MKRIALVLGSDSDLEKVKGALEIFKWFELENGEDYDVRIISAHRTPLSAHNFARSAQKRYDIIIAAAGGAAHLAGVIAANTTVPVIGIPIPTNVAGGMDSLLSTVQMPGGVPVATMGTMGGAKNAALFAMRILALNDEEMRRKYMIFSAHQQLKVNKKDNDIKDKVDSMIAEMEVDRTPEAEYVAKVQENEQPDEGEWAESLA